MCIIHFLCMLKTKSNFTLLTTEYIFTVLLNIPNISLLKLCLENVDKMSLGESSNVNHDFWALFIIYSLVPKSMT